MPLRLFCSGGELVIRHAQARIGLNEGNSPVGSIVILDVEIVGRGRNVVNSQHDVTAHAEVVAIREACEELKKSDLSRGVLYITMEPCPMCCWAILFSGIEVLVLGARLADLQRHYGEYSVETLMKLTGESVKLVTGVLSAECADTWRQKK